MRDAERQSKSRPASGWLSALDTAAAVAMLIAAGTILYTNLFKPQSSRSVRPPVAVPSELQPLEGAAVRGNLAARVAIIEYSDFQCPFCGRFARNELVTLEKQYVDSGRIILAFRNLPLAMHVFAQKAAESAECAARQGKFWQMHDVLFQDQKKLDEASLHTHGADLGLETSAFAACLAGATTEKVKADAAHAARLGLRGTPAFLIGTVQPGGVRVTRVISGAASVDDFTTVLDDLLKAIAR